ncbi:MAG: amidohydrolase family protein, partial [Candidatus Bathyarchaeia archaeon]
MTSIMVKNGFIVTMDKSDRLLTDGAIYIEGQKIIDIGETRDLEKTYRADEVIDASNGVVMPGLVNSHVHFTSVLRRGVEDDLPLEQWLGTLPWHPLYTGTFLHQQLSQKELAAAFRLVLLEMIKAGITCYSAYTGMLRERYESGLRAFCAFLIIDEIGDYKSVLQRIRENYSDRFRFGLGPVSVPLVSEDTLLEVEEVAEKHGLKINMHVAESIGELQEIKRKHGCDGSIEYLNRLGLLSPRLVAAHCVHVSPREIDLMRMREVGVAHCPLSNAKLGDGIAPLADFLKAEITVGLGSDGPATNNCIDMFQEMKFACLLQRAAHCDPTVVKAEDVLRMATIGGAKLLGMDDEIGSIEIGKRADIIIVDFQKPHLYPRTDIVS